MRFRIPDDYCATRYLKNATNTRFSATHLSLPFHKKTPLGQVPGGVLLAELTKEKCLGIFVLGVLNFGTNGLRQRL